MSRLVQDVMVREVVTVSEEDNLEGLEHGMKEYNLRHLPVVAGKRLVGMISHRDMLSLSSSSVSSSRSASVNDSQFKTNTFAASVMTRDLVTVSPETPLLQAVRLLIVNHFGCLPVVDENHELVGIVSEHDLLKEFAAELQKQDVNEIAHV